MLYFTGNKDAGIAYEWIGAILYVLINGSRVGAGGEGKWGAELRTQ